jgi:hypothetical protein
MKKNFIKFYVKLCMTASELCNNRPIKKIIMLVYKVLYDFLARLRYLLNYNNRVFKIETDAADFKTCHYRPIYSVNVTTKSYIEKNLPPMAIVMQGPVMHDYDFTNETIKIYKNHFQDTSIILSTWEGEKIPSDCKADEIILSKKPDYPGYWNINLQIESSKNGMNLAKDLGFEYAVKTRTDQRMYAVNIKKYLFNLIAAFPVRLPHQKFRLVGFSFDSAKELRQISDMFMFGHIEDMTMFWSPEFVRTKTVIEEVTHAYLQIEYYKKIGLGIENTPGVFYKFLADSFIIIDTSPLDFYWPKYTAYESRFVKYRHHVGEEISFMDWLDIYCKPN